MTGATAKVQKRLCFALLCDPVTSGTQSQVSLQPVGHGHPTSKCCHVSHGRRFAHFTKEGREMARGTLPPIFHILRKRLDVHVLQAAVRHYREREPVLLYCAHASRMHFKTCYTFRVNFMYYF